MKRLIGLIFLIMMVVSGCASGVKQDSSVPVRSVASAEYENIVLIFFQHYSDYRTQLGRDLGEKIMKDIFSDDYKKNKKVTMMVSVTEVDDFEDKSASSGTIQILHNPNKQDLAVSVMNFVLKSAEEKGYQVKKTILRKADLKRADVEVLIH